MGAGSAEVTQLPAVAEDGFPLSRRPLHNLSLGRKPEARHLTGPGLSPSPQPSPANGRGGYAKASFRGKDDLKAV